MLNWIKGLFKKKPTPLPVQPARAGRVSSFSSAHAAPYGRSAGQASGPKTGPLYFHPERTSGPRVDDVPTRDAGSNDLMNAMLMSQMISNSHQPSYTPPSESFSSSSCDSGSSWSSSYSSSSSCDSGSSGSWD